MEKRAVAMMMKVVVMDRSFERTIVHNAVIGMHVDGVDCNADDDPDDDVGIEVAA